MKLTVIYEDANPVNKNSFGPHEFLLKCLEDRTSCEPQKIREAIKYVCAKGNGGVISRAKKDHRRHPC